MKKFIILALILALAKISGIAQTVTISGQVPKPYTLTATTLQHFKRVTIDTKGHDEKMHQYMGVALADLLTEADVAMGEGSKKKTITSYVLVTAADNYKTLFALAELDPLFANKTIIMADQVDGKPLPSGEGPFQIIVPDEKKHARWIRQVKDIKLTTIKE